MRDRSPIVRESARIARRPRTAADVLIQTEARYRIIGAKRLRLTGLGVTALGTLAPFSYNRGFGRLHGTVVIHLPFIAAFEAPLKIAVGALIAGAGVVTFIVAVVQLQRAVAHARRDPVAAEVFSEPAKLEPEWDEPAPSGP